MCVRVCMCLRAILQLRRVQPSVPELSLLLDASFLSGQAGSAPQQQLARPTLAELAPRQQSALPHDWPHPPTATEPVPQQQLVLPLNSPCPPPVVQPAPQQQQAPSPGWNCPPPPHTADWNSTCQSPPHHSTPNCGSASSRRCPPSFHCAPLSSLQALPPSNQTPAPSAPSVFSPLTSSDLPTPLPPAWPILPGGPVGRAMTSDAHLLLVQQEQQLRLLQAQVLLVFAAKSLLLRS